MNKRLFLFIGLILLCPVLFANIRFSMVRIEPKGGFVDLPRVCAYIEKYDAVVIYGPLESGVFDNDFSVLRLNLPKEWKLHKIIPMGNSWFNRPMVAALFYNSYRMTIYGFSNILKTDQDSMVRLTIQSRLKVDKNLIVDFYLVDEAVPFADSYATSALNNVLRNLPLDPGLRHNKRPTYFMGQFSKSPIPVLPKKWNFTDAVSEDYVTFQTGIWNEGLSLAHIIFDRASMMKIVRSGVSEDFSSWPTYFSRYKPLFVEVALRTWLEMENDDYVALDQVYKGDTN